MRTSFITDKTEIENVLKSCDICFVGLADKNNTPYVIPMNFGYDGEFMYLHSGPGGKHINIVENENNKVCITFCSERKLRYQHPNVACSYSMESQSVVCKGTVSFLDDNDLAEKEKALNLIMHRLTDNEFRYSEPALKNVKVWKVQIEEITAKAFGQNFKNA